MKRKFRDENTKLAEAAQALIDFTEKQPNVAASELPEKYLGIAAPEVETPAPEAETAPTSESSEQKLRRRNTGGSKLYT